MGNVHAAKFLLGRSGECCNLCGGSALPRRSFSFYLDSNPLLCRVQVLEPGGWLKATLSGAGCVCSRRHLAACLSPHPPCTRSHSPASFPAIIEHVRDGSVVRALLLPDYYLVTVMLSGIKVKAHSEETSAQSARERWNK